MVRVGDAVKIYDVGTLAICRGVRKGELELELDGERFWIAKKYCKAVR